MVLTKEIARHERALSSPFARHLDLWAFAFSLVVIGDYSGFNYGLQFGWINSLIAFILATTMYWLLGLSIAEMTCSLPFSGGPATFAHAAFGHGVSAFNGMSFVVMYCILIAQSLVALGRYSVLIFGIPSDVVWCQPLLWIPFVLLLLLSNNGGKRFFGCSIFLSGVLGIGLLTYICLALVRIPKIDTTVFSSSIEFLSVIKAFPYMLWFYLGIECIPVSSEECLDITRSAPRATVSTLVTLTTLGIFLLALAPGLMPSNHHSWESRQPILDSFFFNLKVPLNSLAARVITGLMMILVNYAAGHNGFYVSARHVYTLARAGYLPINLASTVQGTPRNTNYAVVSVSYVIALIFWGLAQTGFDVNTLYLQVITWFGCLSYLVEMTVYIRLRTKMPLFPRPWRSPTGTMGAVIAALISAVGVLGAFAVDWKIYGILLLVVIVMMLLFTVYYYLFARTRLLMCPEREYISAQLNRLFQRKVNDSSSTEIIDSKAGNSISADPHQTPRLRTIDNSLSA